MAKRKMRKAIVVGVIFIVGLGILATRYDKCDQCGNWYGPLMPHIFRHEVVPTFWGFVLTGVLCHRVASER